MRVYKEDLIYIESFWSGRKRVFYKDEECFKNENGAYEYYSKEEDAKKEITVIGSLLNGVVIKIDDREIEMVGKIKWYEYLLCFAFLGLLFYDSNYLIGGLVSSIFGIINLIVIRGIKNKFFKVLASVLVAAIAFLVLFVVLKIFEYFNNKE